MRARQPELRAIPQFDSGRWKLRLEFMPVATDKRSDNEHNSDQIETAIRKRILITANNSGSCANLEKESRSFQ